MSFISDFNAYTVPRSAAENPSRKDSMKNGIFKIRQKKSQSKEKLEKIKTEHKIFM